MNLQLEPNVFLAALAVFTIGAFVVFMLTIYAVGMVVTALALLVRGAWDIIKPKRIAS